MGKKNAIKPKKTLLAAKQAKAELDLDLIE